MGWNHNVGALERLIETGAAASLGAASAVAVARLAPVAGMALWAVTIACALGAAVAALALLRCFDPASGEGRHFEPVDIADATELLLDERLSAPPLDARVVRLFGASALPGPGEMANQIADYLESGRGAGDMVCHSPPVAAEASAALHAALADIRRSLR